LFDGLRPTLMERIWMTQPKTCVEFLTATRLLSKAAEVVGQESWVVNLLAEEKEKQLQAMALLTEEQGVTRKKIVVSKGRRIPPRSMAAVVVQQTEAVEPGQEGAAWMIEPERKLLEAKGLTAGKAILREYRAAFHILVVNLEKRPTVVHQGTVLGERAEIE
jgi:hypothetical protein